MRVGGNNLADQEEAQQNNKCNGCRSKSCKWAIQSFLWTFWIFFLLKFGVWGIGTTTLIILLVGLGFFSFIYSLCFCFSHTCQYLKNLRTSNGVVTYLSSIFYKPGFITFYAECYHYVSSYHRHRNGSTSRSRRKVVTYTETRRFPFKSWRDISGEFNLDLTHLSDPNAKPLLKLELQKSIEFADDGTEDDYEYFRESMRYRIQHIDTNYNLEEKAEIAGLESFNLVNLSDSIPCGIGMFWFIISLFFFLAEIYKVFFNKHCNYYKFKIRKLISTVNDLNVDVNSAEYQKDVPRVVIHKEDFKFFDLGKYEALPNTIDTPQNQIKEGGSNPKPRDEGDDDPKNYISNAPVHKRLGNN